MHLENCLECVGRTPLDCPLSEMPRPRNREKFFQSEIGHLFEVVENSEVFTNIIRPMICDAENVQRSVNQTKGRIDKIASIIFAELSYVYVRDHMGRLNLKVLSPTLTEDIFRFAGKHNLITPDGLVLKEEIGDDQEPINLIVGVCEYTMSKKPAYHRDKKAQRDVYKDGKFLEFVNAIASRRKHIVELMISQENGDPKKLWFDKNRYIGTVLGLTRDPSTEGSLAKLGLKGFEHHLPIFREGLSEYVEHLFRVFREPIWQV